MVALVPSEWLASYCCCSVAGLLLGSANRALYASSALFTASPATRPPARSPSPVPPTTQVQSRPPPGACAPGLGGGLDGRAGGGADRSCATSAGPKSMANGLSGSPARAGP